MNMKKSLIAMAVAGVVAAPATASAAEVYGRVNVAVQQQNDDAAPADGELSLQDISSRFGAQGSEDLGNGLTAFYRYEFSVDATGATGFAANDRLSYAGLEGDFGRVEAGQIWSLWWDHLGSKVDWSWALGGNGYYLSGILGGAIATPHREPDSIQYSYGQGGPFEFGVEVQMVPGVTGPSGQTEDMERVILAGSADVGPVNLSAANWSVSNPTPGGAEPSVTGLGASWASGPLSVAGVYQMVDPDAGNADPTALDIRAGYAFGDGLNGYVSYGTIDADDGSGGNQDLSGVWATLDKSLSERTGAYVELESLTLEEGNAADSDPTTVLFGLRHDF